jgi:hypothetical protein
VRDRFQFRELYASALLHWLICPLISSIWFLSKYSVRVQRHTYIELALLVSFLTAARVCRIRTDD